MGTRRLAVLGAVVLAAGLLTGCAAATPLPGGSPQATVSATAPAEQPSPSTQASVPSSGGSQVPFSFPPPASGKPGTSLDQTITGQVEAGVERGCLVLRDTSGTYQLLGGDPTIVYAGAQVSLTGHVVTGVMSYCQQGIPFQITQARRL